MILPQFEIKCLKFEIECLNKVCRCRFSQINPNDSKVENMALMTCTCLRWHTPVFYNTFKKYFDMNHLQHT